MATKDPITNMANRYMLVQELEVAHENCRADEDLSLLFIDIDHFKQINDTHGHEFGDKVLKHIAAHIEDSLRPNDVAGRYGGEEFLVGLPGCSLENAHMIADRMRSALNANPYTDANGDQVALSMSIGVASLSHHPGSLDELIKFADQAMYAAKDQGRNQFVAFQSRR